MAPPLPGAMRVGFRPFLMFSALGALLWVTVPVVLGAIFSAEVEWALQRLSELGSGALLLIGVVIVGYAGIKLTQRYLFLRMLRVAR